MKLLKKGGNIFLERSSFLVAKKPEERVELDAKLKELAKDYGELSLVGESE